MKKFYINKNKLIDNFWFFAAIVALIIANAIIMDNRRWPEKNISRTGLDYFTRWFEEDPLLLSPHLDIESFEESLGRLKEENGLFKQKFGFKADIFPIGFLEAFAEANKEYSAFKKDVSPDSAQALVASLEDCARFYVQGITSLKDEVKNINGSTKKSAKYVSFPGNSYFDTNIVLSDLEKMLENAETLSIEISERKACLEGDIQTCRIPSFSFVKPEEGDRKSAEVDEMALSMTEDEGYSRAYDIASGCWQGRERDLFRAGEHCYKSLGYCVKDIVLVDRPYFKKIVPSFPYERELLSRGVEVVAETLAAPYLCNYTGYQAITAGLDGFYSKYEDSRIFERLGQEISDDRAEEIIRDGLDAENDFFGAEYPSDLSLKNLAGNYAYAYSFLKKNNMGRDDVISELLDRYLEAEEAASGFSGLVNRIALHMWNLRMSYEASGSIPAEDYVYMTRNDYSLLFFNHSPFVWRINEQPNYVVLPEGGSRDGALASARVMEYNTAMEKYGKDMMEKWRNIVNSIDKTDFYINFMESKDAGH